MTQFTYTFTGNFGQFSHFDGSEYAFDFSMPEGTPILAATEGVVVETKEDSDQGTCTGVCVWQICVRGCVYVCVSLTSDNLLRWP